jgi:hypothetical protein
MGLGLERDPRRIATPQGERLYVGCTGDLGSFNAGSRFAPIREHPGKNRRSNALRGNLMRHGIAPEACASFKFIVSGPLYPEAKDYPSHRKLAEKVHALEKVLADALTDAGYGVINRVYCLFPPDMRTWPPILAEPRRGEASSYTCSFVGAASPPPCAAAWGYAGG